MSSRRSEPFVIVNMAASLDGKISDEKRRQIRISCEEDLRRVDELRASCDAIMVGIGTVLADDPSLTVKSDELRAKRLLRGKPPNPLRVVVDSRCRIPIDAKVLDSRAKTIVAVASVADPSKVEEVRKKAEVVVLGEERVDLKSLMDYLAARGVKRLLVEGGGTLVSSLLRQRLVDELIVYYSPMVIGGSSSPTICDGESFDPPLRCEIVEAKRFGEGFLIRARF
ncbi:MAG: 2,5-diamino-6-(ribosylamino)-4(3H)-pyrimidinone 5'-phosphate reductase [Archaeoglobaceae archaeon]